MWGMNSVAPKLLIWSLIGLLIGAALLITGARGNAILLDLSAMTAGLLCF